jgi:hypothetical protein
VSIRSMKTAAAAGVILLAVPAAASSQSLSGRLSTLLTEQQTASIYVPDVPAAEATRDTVAKLFGVELTNLPTASSSGGFVYRLNPSLGVVSRSSEGFGPFFTERVLRNGEGQFSAGFSYQVARFTSLQGADLTAGSFPTNAARMVGATQPFAVDTLALDLDTQTATVFTSYGVTDRLAVGGSLPFVRIRMRGTRMRIQDGGTSLQSRQSGTAAGLGDLALNARYLVVGDGLRGVSVGGDLRLPTGRTGDLLGSGKAAFRGVALGSYEEGRLGVNVNAGVGVGGASREVSWSMATTFAASSRVTLVGEMIGRRLFELSYVQDVYQPHPLMPGVETMRWLTADRGFTTTLVATGAKWNIGGSWLINTNLLIRLTDGGLRSRVTPAVSLDYDFGL